MQGHRQRVAVLLSGGVDSSVALKLLIDQRQYEIHAFYLKIWLEDELAFLGNCPWEDDLNVCHAVCDQFQIPLKIISLQHEYHDRIVSHALSELKQGRTPSPDIYCNQHIKFGVFFEKLSETYDWVASGHYAKVEHSESGGLSKLLRAPDKVKDQTYFLSNLSQEQLRKILFPLGSFTKSQVRELAEDFDLPNKKRKDSQGICFLGKIPYRDFVKYHLGEKKGDIVELETNLKKGTHQGVWFHTIGQRKGLGLGEGPWYVVKKDIDQNIVYISHSDQYLHQAKSTFEVSSMNWISGCSDAKFVNFCKVRHGPELIACEIEVIDEHVFRVIMNTSDSGIASGQHAIFYHNEECLGGGMILEEG